MNRILAWSFVLLFTVALARPAVSQTVAAPRVSDIPRLVRLVESLDGLSNTEAERTLRQLSLEDMRGMLWVMQVRAGQSSSPSSTSRNLSPRYSAPTTPRSSSVYSAPSFTPLPSAAYGYAAPESRPKKASGTEYEGYGRRSSSRIPKSIGYGTEESAVITANPYGGVPISQYDHRVSKYSPDGALNPYTTGGGKIIGADGSYLGKLNSNKYDPESVANPYGQYGSKYSPNSINNPYSEYGSKYSPKSAKNPYAVTPPKVIYGDSFRRW